mgnify:CR=1 FL=1
MIRSTPVVSAEMKSRSLRLACADFTFPLLSLDQALDLICSLGFKGVDIGFFAAGGHLDISRELENPRLSARRLLRKLERRGLHLADLFLVPGRSFGEMSPNHPDATMRRRAREQFRQVVEYVRLAGGRHVGGLPGIPWKQERRVDSFERACEELAWRVEHARNHGVVYSVEPHIGSIAPRPRDAERLVNAVPGLTLTLDYTHFTRAGIPDADVEPLLKHASHFHCRGGRKGRLQCSFKDNTIDYTRVLEVMAKVGYRGYIALEYVWSPWEKCNEADTLSETILFRNFFSKPL